MNKTPIKLTPMKKAMVKQMVKSLEIPQFQLETEVDCNRLMALRKEVSYKPSVTTVLAKAVAETLKNHPMLNASFVDASMVETYDEIGLGIAVDTPRGLVVPVIHDAGNLNLRQFHEAMEEIKEKGKKGIFAMDDLSGGTFTISNLGMFHVISFRAIVNAPQVGILALSKIVERPVVRDGQIQIARMMNVTISADHRVADGATCARFLSELAERIEHPEELMAE